MSLTDETADSPSAPAAGGDRLSPWPVRVAVWIALVAIAVLAIRIIDDHAMKLQREGQAPHANQTERLQLDP